MLPARFRLCVLELRIRESLERGCAVTFLAHDVLAAPPHRSDVLVEQEGGGVGLASASLSVVVDDLRWGLPSLRAEQMLGIGVKILTRRRERRHYRLVVTV